MVADLRPRGIGEILDAAVSLYRSRFGALVRCAAVVVVPLQAFLAVVQLSAQPDHFSIALNGSATPRFDTTRAQLGATVLVLVVGALTHAFVVAVSTRIVADRYVDHDEATGVLLRRAGRRFLAVVGVALIVGVLQVVGLFLCVVGILVPMTFFAVAVPALILEHKGVFGSLGRSVDLVRTHFWHVLGLVLSASLIAGLLNAALAAGLDLWITRVGTTTAIVVAQAMTNTISSLLTTPFVATATVALYFDLRIRDEAFDVQLAIARRPVAAASHADVR